MAGTSYFNAGSGGSGTSPYKPLKPIPLLNRTNIPKLTNIQSTFYNNLPVWRSSAANNYFQFSSSGTVCTLYSVNAAGASSSVGVSTFNTYLTGSEAAVIHLNSTDQCLYVLLFESPNYRLIKIGDSSGTTTTIGSSFTVATPNNWPKSYNSDMGTMSVDGSGHLRIYYRGFYHQINKTTGAIVSQDNAVTIGSYSLVNTVYLSLDGTTATGSPYTVAGTTGNPALKLGAVVSASIGSTYLQIPSNLTNSSDYFSKYMFLVDDDKMFFGQISTDDTDTISPNYNYIYRSDYDQFVRSVIDYSIGA